MESPQYVVTIYVYLAIFLLDTQDVHAKLDKLSGDDMNRFLLGLLAKKNPDWKSDSASFLQFNIL